DKRLGREVVGPVEVLLRSLAGYGVQPNDGRRFSIASRRLQHQRQWLFSMCERHGNTNRQTCPDRRPELRKVEPDRVKKLAQFRVFYCRHVSSPVGSHVVSLRTLSCTFIKTSYKCCSWVNSNFGDEKKRYRIAALVTLVCL